MSKVHIGINKSNPKETVIWDTDHVVNGHWIIVGGSGSGKTHRIIDITKQLGKEPVHLHVFDVHGDIRTDPEYTSEVEFSELSPFGLNPLAINPSPVYGGIRKRINSLVRIINKYSAMLNDKEEAVLRYVLRELYGSHGFDYKDPSTWGAGSKKIPTLEDLKELLYLKLKGYFGADAETGEFERFLRYESREVVKALYNRINKMLDMGVFKSLPPPFDPGKPIWLYSMSSLYVEEQGYLVELTLEQLFSDAVQRGLRDTVDTLAFIDEAQRFISANDQDHIISVIFREIRKFGGGLVLATQNCETFPTDVIVNSGTKMILGVDEGYHDILAKKLGVERIRFIQPRKNALVQIKTKTTSAGSRFVDTLLSLPGEKVTNTGSDCE